MTRFLAFAILILSLASSAWSSETSTTIPVSYLAWNTVGNHTVPLTLSASEQIAVLTSDPRRWVSVQINGSIDYTLRWTQGSSTDAVSLKANQTYTIRVEGTGFTFYPIAGGAGTLTVTPVCYELPQ